jgi:TRAP transporter 4TM/12TM fusion protein
MSAETSSRFDPFADAPLTERRSRSFGTAWKWLLVAVLIAFSAFHLYTGTAGILTARLQRSTHLAFALLLAMILFPGSPIRAVAGLLRFAVRLVMLPLLPVPRVRRAFRQIRPTSDAIVERLQGTCSRFGLPRVGFALSVLAAVVGAGCAAYVGLFNEQLAERAGAPTSMDLWVAGIGIVLILEATRRSVSPALFYITLGFLAYGLFGHLIPADLLGRGGIDLGHRQKDLTYILNHQFYSEDAVFGIPLAVSSTFVFLFVLFGAALDRSGAGRYLIDLAFATMGRFRGGPAKAAVFASGTMGTISGSSIANTVTTGSLTIPLMKKAGFKPHVAGAVEVAASTNGQLVPPVMGAAAFIMAEFTGIPYSRIIIAAALPALLSYLAIFTMIHLNAAKSGIQPSDPADVPPLRRTLLRGLHLNLPLLAVLFFLMVGDPRALVTEGRLAPFSPTLSATLAIWVTLGLYLLVALVAPLTAYGLTALAEPRQSAAPPRVHAAQRITFFTTRTLLALRDAGMNMVGIACACACCGIIIGIVAQTGLGLKVTAIIAEISGGQLLPALLLTALACILLGIGLPTTATYIIMAALTAPALLSIAGGDGGETSVPLLLAAHLFVFYYGILADDTPPVGLCAYAAAGIAGSDPIRTGLTSFRFDLAAFMLPLIFFYNRELLLFDVTWWQVLWVLPGAVVAMLSFAAALEGYAFGRLRWWARGLLVLTAFLLIHPDLWKTAVGAVLLALVLAFGHIRLASKPAVD